MGSSSKVVRPEEVLESLKNDGTVDALRMKIIAQLKANVCLRLLSHILALYNPLLLPRSCPRWLGCGEFHMVGSLMARWQSEYRIVEDQDHHCSGYGFFFSSFLC